MVQNFKYIFSQLAKNMKITIKSNTQIIKCIGGENSLPNEYINQNNSDEAPNVSNEVSFNFGSTFSSDLLKKLNIIMV